MKELSSLLAEAKKHNRTCGIFLAIFIVFTFSVTLLSDEIKSDTPKIILSVIEGAFAISLFLFALVPALASSKKLKKALYKWIAECFFSDEEFLKGDEVVFFFEFFQKNREVSFTRQDTAKNTTFNISALKSWSYLYSDVSNACVQFMAAYYERRGGANNVFIATEKEVITLVSDGNVLYNMKKNKFLLWGIVK